MSISIKTRGARGITITVRKEVLRGTGFWSKGMIGWRTYRNGEWEIRERDEELNANIPLWSSVSGGREA